MQHAPLGRHSVNRELFLLTHSMNGPHSDLEGLVAAALLVKFPKWVDTLCKLRSTYMILTALI